MEWFCFIISLLSLLVFGWLAWSRYRSEYKSSRLLDPLKILMIGVAIATAILFIPIYKEEFSDTNCGVWEIFFICVHNMIRLFVVDADFTFITDNLGDMTGLLQLLYTAYFAVLYVVAPVLTFSLVLSFFKNISSFIWYALRGKKEVYIFSELNEKSFALAEDLKKQNTQREIVFTEVVESEDEKYSELYEKARSLRAVCFKRDILTVDFTVRHKKAQLYFFTFSENPAKNISEGVQLIEKYKSRANTHLYILSSELESELLLTKAFRQESSAPAGIKVRRVKEVQSLINRNLYEKGYEQIFASALDDGTGVKKINALVVGMGQHGTEMTKALAWYCQMDNYEVNIDAVDKDSAANDKFSSLCPELMSNTYNGRQNDPNEACYKIRIHSGMDVSTKTFDDMVQNLSPITYVMVCLGNDALNIATAVKLRTLFAQKGWMPKIQAVIYDSERKQALAGITNYKGQPYAIDFIGDMKASYNCSTIMKSDLEEQALARHMKWVIKAFEEKKQALERKMAQVQQSQQEKQTLETELEQLQQQFQQEKIEAENAFWQYDYNYSSSVASAIHYKAKCDCEIPGILQNPNDRTEEARWALRRIEHRRWNAYMRTEGYISSGHSHDPSTRNVLAKKHHCLAPFDKLPLSEQEKDDD